MLYKKAVFIFLSIFLCSFIMVPIFLVKDPLGLYASKLVPIQDNMYFQAKNIINNAKYDSIILGTSMLENTSSKDANKFIGGNFINISMFGSDFNARFIVINYTLKQRKLKNIIYSLDGETKYAIEAGYNKQSWAYLYDNNNINDIKAYINTKWIRQIFLFNGKKKLNENINVDRPTAWFSNKDIISSWSGIKSWSNYYQKEIAHKLSTHNIIYASTLANLEQYLNNNIFRLVIDNRNIKFIFIYPPYSTLSYKLELLNNREEINFRIALLKYFAKKCSKYSNCNLYAFGNMDFTNDLRNYKDLLHYSEKINTLMLEKISKDENRVTADNIDFYVEDFVEKVKKYDIIPIIEELKQIRPDLKDCIEHKNCSLQ